ncbi:RNaseH domain-containing protein [Streptomyces phaeoluteigriseus]|uniref:RNaseH domain-containing protein n=1 Tax=Streptomyces phaeoluteigriseus TaxID=114686 RepID=A0ABY4Z1D3_9ACTN|nr:RNaseH domain-containing protein [Streptomyces phaeoluteigriseus]USQ82564.1 RNaseH domain-containing protein [Streptomyces phaeoluteigriseus]
MNDQIFEPGKYLHTLAYRCTPGLVGDTTVHVRRLDTETAKLWSTFTAQCRKRFGKEEAQAPYTIATTVLQVITGGYVFFEPKGASPFLVSRRSIDSDLLRKALALTHGLALGEQVEMIDLRQPPELARRIAQTPEREIALHEHLEGAAGVQPDAPNWLYRSVSWGLAERLAAVPFQLSNGREITLRPDTTGGLVALDDAWENEGGGRYAVCRTAVRLKTLPNVQHPVLLLDSRVSRISSSLIFSSTALAVQPGEGRPVLEVKLNGRGGAKTIPRQALEALGRLEMDYSILQSIKKRSEHEQKLRERARAFKEKLQFPRVHPGQIWPIPAKNYKHPIGTGVGMHHLRLLRAHADAVFGEETQRLPLRQSAMTLPRRPTALETVTAQELKRRKEERERTGSKEPLRSRGSLFPSAESLCISVDEAGFKKLRIACLWYRDETRQRMLQTFCRAFGLDPVGLDTQEGVEVDLYQGRITAVFYYAPDFLRPGRGRDRAEALETLAASLRPRDGILVGSWCETELPHADDFPSIDARDLDDLDAKPQTKAVLARLDVPSQYLMGRGKDGVIESGGEDHPAQMALLDLYRSLGVTDERISNALQSKGGYPVDRIAHVGVHVRQQNRRFGEKGEPKIVITATALVPPHASEGAWSLLGWSSTAPVWRPYRSAQNAFHAHPYPEPSAEMTSYRQKWDGAADMVERALGDLVDELDGVAYTVTVDAQSARRMWDGLQNVRLGEQHAKTGTDSNRSRYQLPGERLGGDAPLAVIRLNTEDEEVPQPVSVTHMGKKEGAEPVERDTSTLLFEVATDFGTPVWLLCNVPRAFDGSGAGRLGSKRTRWEAEKSVQSEDRSERRKGEMPQNFYAMTATEILPIGGPSDAAREALAAMTARLCHQTLFWSDRARYPVPLHAARQMDLDHPQYWREAADAEPGSGDDAEEGEATE